jgi:hypothetical protein
VVNRLKSEAESRECSFEIMRIIDEKRRLLDLLLLAEFTEK